MAKRIYLGIIFFIVVTIGIFPFMGTVEAKDSIILTVASTWAPDWPTNVFQKMWEKKVTAATNGRVQFRNFWGGSLVSMGEETDALESGTVDISCMCACFYPSAMPMNNICWGLFFIPNDPTMQLEIYRRLRKEFPQMTQEVEKHNCKLLFMSAVDTYGLFSKKPIRTFEALQGKKISGIGRYHPKFFKQMGAELISMHVADRYSAMQTGVLDGDFLPLLFTKPFRYWEVAPYRTMMATGGNNGMPHCISLNVWNKLSPEYQKIMLEAGKEVEKEAAQWTADNLNHFLEKLQKEEGVKTVPFPREEKIKCCEAIGDTLWDYARDLENDGLPGFEYVKAYIRHAKDLGFDFPCKQYNNPSNR